MKITSKQQKEINKIGEKHNLDLVVLHGSQATGKIVTRHPDIDIAVYRRGGISFKEQVNLIGKFMSIFGNDVDLKSLHHKNPLFLFEVMRNAQLLYGNKNFFNEFFIYTYKVYQDARPLYRNLAIIQKKRQELFNKMYA